MDYSKIIKLNEEDLKSIISGINEGKVIFFDVRAPSQRIKSFNGTVIMELPSMLLKRKGFGIQEIAKYLDVNTNQGSELFFEAFEKKNKIVFLFDENVTEGYIENHLLIPKLVIGFESLEEFYSRVFIFQNTKSFLESNPEFENQNQYEKRQKLNDSFLLPSIVETPMILGNPIDSVPDEIINGLYLGDIHSSRNLNSLRNLGITTIVNMTSEPNAFSENEFTYKNYPISDSIEQLIDMEEIEKIMNLIDEVINKKGEKVLVHCQAGISRSATVVIMYLMKSQKIKAEDAYALCKSKRRVVGPNVGFLAQIYQYQKSLFSE